MSSNSSDDQEKGKQQRFSNKKLLIKLDLGNNIS